MFAQVLDVAVGIVLQVPDNRCVHAWLSRSAIVTACDLKINMARPVTVSYGAWFAVSASARCARPARVYCKQLPRELLYVRPPLGAALEQSNETTRQATDPEIRAGQRPCHCGQRVRVPAEEDHVTDGCLERLRGQGEARDGGRHRVQRFDPIAQSGKVVRGLDPCRL